MASHRLSKHPLYRRWAGIKNRCLNTNNPLYKYYGARGITICDEWKNDFKAFYDYVMSLPNYNLKLTIERIDNDGNYEPGNIKWADMFEQCANKRYPKGFIHPNPNATHFTMRISDDLKEIALANAKSKGLKLSAYIKGFLESDVVESLESFVDYYKDYEEVLNDELRAIVQKGKDALNKAKS